MKYIITKTEPFIKYFGASQDSNMICEDLYSLFDISCVKISEPLFDTIYPLIPAGYEEISEQQATNGSNFFGETRDQVKVLSKNSVWAETDAIPDSEKEMLVMSDEIINDVVQFMYKFAKEIIEQEYNYRFKVLKNVSELEHSSWEIQKHEAKEWLDFKGVDGHITPFLDYIATERGLDKTELSNKILAKAELWNDKLSIMLVESQTLLKKFEVVTTVWDMNILYEDYFGIMMSNTQAIELGRMDSAGNRVTVDNKIDINNPYIGNKLNF